MDAPRLFIAQQFCPELENLCHAYGLSAQLAFDAGLSTVNAAVNALREWQRAIVRAFFASDAFKTLARSIAYAAVPHLRPSVRHRAYMHRRSRYLKRHRYHHRHAGARF